MITKAIEALENRNFKGFAACFSEKADFADFCPLLQGGQPVYLVGNIAIEMYFHERFVSKRFCAAEPEIESDTAASIFCEYDHGPYHYVRFSIEESDGDGLIRKAVIHPL